MPDISGNYFILNIGVEQIEDLLVIVIFEIVFVESLV